ncbi:MAG: hypothetical protein A4S09_16145 [Proteobacteria bacterium SG_bin7]|nr:MAG: hypothetical protein A4S09_16145 [Proteobacteria bacterium SG_bin7]
MKNLVILLVMSLMSVFARANGPDKVKTCTFGHNPYGWYLHLGSSMLPYEKELASVIAQASDWITSGRCLPEAGECELGDHRRQGFGLFFWTRGGRSPYYRDMDAILADISLLKGVGLCR